MEKLFEKSIISTFHTYRNSNYKVRNKNFNNRYVKRFQGEIDNIDDVKSDEDIYEELMKIDSKIRVKYYGSLNTSNII